MALGAMFCVSCQDNETDAGQEAAPKVLSLIPKAGSAGSCVDLLHVQSFNHQVETVEGVLQEECASLMKDFFRELRAKQKIKKAAASG